MTFWNSTSYSDFPTDQTFLWPWYWAWTLPICDSFQWKIHNGHDIRERLHFWTPVSVPFWDWVYATIVETNFPELAVFSLGTFAILLIRAHAWPSSFLPPPPPLVLLKSWATHVWGIISMVSVYKLLKSRCAETTMSTDRLTLTFSLWVNRGPYCVIGITCDFFRKYKHRRYKYNSDIVWN